jgi:precorrin-8X/cobalt-precorrin-8 methylmutase
MAVFDRYIAVDWSAHNGPKTGADSIWIGEWGPAGPGPSRNPPTRAAAMADLEHTLLAARAAGERILLGFDFVFGFPAGAAEAIAGAAPPLPSSPAGGEVPIECVARSPSHPPADTLPLAGRDGEGEAPRSNLSPPWSRLWSTLHTLITDTDQNLSNRFEVAETLNRVGGRFWGHPHGRLYAHLTPKKPLAAHPLPERRGVEALVRGPQPVWKLTGVGAVGSQTLLGIPRLEALRRHRVLGPDIAVWPFDTDFERHLERPLVIAEIYPSLFTPAPGIEPRDRAQVQACVARYAALDAAGDLRTFLSAPPGLDPAIRALAVGQEGWIAGIGHQHLWQAAPDRQAAA